MGYPNEIPWYTRVYSSILRYAGLLRISEHSEIVGAYKSFTYKLAQEAKEHGVNVLLNKDSWVEKEVLGKSFIVGDMSSISDCKFNDTLTIQPGAAKVKITGSCFFKNPVKI